ncbi:hypothetical protein FIU87_04725 [Bacillus sp. THAF10]|uniref:DUF2178 domain-containing protein n=1 Tax=Bacillus sp. THAF10 TaxID=2587848 RepID=UPI0012A86446|nr:DUF2178 domain-containing protein [Bacillus sp. THAF10]QFT87953.1 hypothetical protein FIU87_04725 [Bacillus sp. THAF10]
MGKFKMFSIVISSLVLLVIVGFGIFNWFSKGFIDLNAMFAGAIAVGWLFNALTWGDINGDETKDELDKHIQTQSAKIGYFILMTLAFLILVITEGVGNLNDIQNVPLAVVVFLSLAVLPVTEFFYARKFR